MEQSELERIAHLSTKNDELKHLFYKHQGFEKELSRLEGIRFPSESERRTIGKLKRQKLLGKDRIRRILASHP
jgi:uncharacterized protein YdcH (DUF465 family)